MEHSGDWTPHSIPLGKTNCACFRQTIELPLLSNEDEDVTSLSPLTKFSILPSKRRANFPHEDSFTFVARSRRSSRRHKSCEPCPCKPWLGASILTEIFPWCGWNPAKETECLLERDERLLHGFSPNQRWQKLTEPTVVATSRCTHKCYCLVMEELRLALNKSSTLLCLLWLMMKWTVRQQWIQESRYPSLKCSCISWPLRKRRRAWVPSTKNGERSLTALIVKFSYHLDGRFQRLDRFRMLCRETQSTGSKVKRRY